MIHDEVWLAERRKLFKTRVRPYLTRCLKVKYADRLEPLFLGEVRPKGYENLDSLFEDWWYEDTPVDWAFHLMPFESFETKLDYFLEHVMTSTSKGRTAVHPGVDYFSLGWTEEEEDQWYDHLYGKFALGLPVVGSAGKSYQYDYSHLLSSWLITLEDYFLGYREKKRCLRRDGAFFTRRIDLFFKLCEQLDSRILLPVLPESGEVPKENLKTYRLQCSRLKFLCKLSVDYRRGFIHKREKGSLIHDSRYDCPDFEDNGDVDYKMKVLSEMREYFSSMPAFSEMYAAAINTKTWKEYYWLGKK